MSLNDVVAEFRTGDYQVRRQTAGTYVFGVYVSDPSPSVFVVEASVVPATGLTIVAETDGQRSTNTKIMYCVTELRTRDGSGAADVVTIDGEEYEVVNVKRWEGFQEDSTADLFEVSLARQEVP